MRLRQLLVTSKADTKLPDEASITEALKHYAAGPDILEAELDGITDAELDSSLSGDSWTIREIIHHLAEADSRHITFTRIALVSSGSAFEFSWHPGNKAMSEALNYTGQPIELALTLFRSNREYFALILSSMAEAAWDRYLAVKGSPDAEGQNVTVQVWVIGMARHLQEHLEVIAMIRNAHARQGPHFGSAKGVIHITDDFEAP